MASKYGSAAPQPPKTEREAAQWLCGWAGAEKATEALHAIQADGRTFAESFYQFRITGAPANSGAGKTVRGWELYEKVTGREPDTTPQPTGNCLIAGSMVLMADGSEKPIEDVVTGDMVRGPSGATRRVTETLSRPYSGEIVTLCAGVAMRPVSATPEHEFAVVEAGSDAPRWVPLSQLQQDQRLFQAAGETQSAVRRLSTAQLSDGFVYCLRVEDENAFIANGYAVHNCVAAAADDIVELTQCVQILVNGGTFKPIYNPFHYATGRVLVGKNQLRGGAGSIGSWQAKALELYGAIPLTADLPAYTQQNVDAWGDDKPAGGKSFRDFMEAAKENVVQTTSLVSSWEQQRDAMFAGHFSTIASNRGYAMLQDSQGFHRPSGAWGHQMSIQGYSEDPKYPQWVAIKNQWGGKTHGVIKDFETGKAWPGGFLRVRLADYINRHLRMAGAECIVFSGFKGYPALDLWTKGWA